MTHRDKVARFEQLLKDRGYWVSNAIPPAWRLLWRFGFKAPPPYFLSFPIGALSAGLPFGIVWGAFMWLIFWWVMPPWVMIVMASLAAVIFGLAMAAFWRIQSHRLGLQSWQQFPDGKQLNA
jgi:hypothetical protein